LAHFRTQLPARFDVASGAVVFNAVLSDIDGTTGLATSIKRIDMMVDEA
jgi:calcineurin-like phosphoesterase